jgi:hypothetical protein
MAFARRFGARYPVPLMAPGVPIRGSHQCWPLYAAAVALLALLPAGLRAETLVFRNDTNAPLVIQGACVVNGRLRHDQPIAMAPGATARIVLPGNKLITVYHAKLPNRILFQGTIQEGKDDRYFLMEPVPAVGKVDMKEVKPGAMGGMPGR